MGPFDLLAPAPPRRFSGDDPRNAYVELHNVIAAAASVDEFGPADRVRISRAHGVDLARSFLAERLALYQVLLEDRLANADLDREDRRVLAHVAQTLALTPAELRGPHERAFGTAVTQAVSDDCLSVEERLLLYKLQHLLGLDPDIADGAYDVLARERLLKVIAGALCDGELSPDEGDEIARVRELLSLTIPSEVQSMMEQARARWQVRRGTLPKVAVPIPVETSEAGRYVARATWSFLNVDRLEEHMGRGVLHNGRTAGLIVPSHVLTGRQRRGRVVLTSRRLVFLPDAGLPDEYRLDRFVQLLRFRNGIVVRTKSDRRVYFDPGDDNETFYSLFYRAVHDTRPVSPR